MLPLLFQLSHPVVLGDRDAGQPMLVRIGRLRKSTPDAKYLIRDCFGESPGFFFRRVQARSCRSQPSTSRVGQAGA
jgi:hypothetical protein